MPEQNKGKDKKVEAVKAKTADVKKGTSQVKAKEIKIKPGLKGNKLFRLLMILIKKDKDFYLVVSMLFLVAGIAYPYPQVAMWIGFAFAGYSAIANDSIQTIGTFIASNADKKWWQLWLFIGLIFVGTVFFSWYTFSGDVSYQRLTSKGFDTAPDTFAYLQIAAPLVLLIITRLRMPVSTTFLLLSAFSADSTGILKVTQKSMFGYIIAFVVAISVWYLMSKFIKRFTSGPAKPYWRNIQWVTSGTLWSVWIMQDAANIAIFLPRALSVWEFVAFTGYIFIGLGLLFYTKGGKIQEIVKEKAEISEIRGATLVDFVYALILIFFQQLSKVPMSTTWVFIGLLGGREIAMKLSKDFDSPGTLKKTLSLVWRDLSYALIGLAISVLLAIAVNAELQREIKSLFTF
jgi:phosphate/sulfate permease